jgi:hypothetical protein
VSGGFFAVVTAFVLSLLAREARAEDAARGVELDWRVVDGCPGRERIESGVQRITGRTIRESSGSFVVLRVSISAEGELFRMTLAALRTDGVQSERTVLAPTCEQAAEAAIAVLVTTLGEPGATASGAPGAQTPPPPTQDPAVAPPAGASRAEDVPSADSPRNRAAVEGFAGAAVGVELGTLPKPAVFGQVMGGLALGRFLVRAAGAVALPVSDELTGTQAGADIGFARGTLIGCYRVPWQPGLLGICAGGELGSLSASGFGVENDEPGSALWSAAVIAGVMRVDVAGPFALSAGGELLLPFRSLEVVVRPEAPIHRTPPVTARVWLGAELIFH